MAIDVKIQVRFNDLDGYAHVNNSVYLSYLEVARCDAFGSVFIKGLDCGLWYILSEAQILYKKPITFGEEVYVNVKMIEAKGARFIVEYSLHNGEGKVFATAKTVHAILDAKTGRPLRITDEVKAMLDK